METSFQDWFIDQLEKGRLIVRLSIFSGDTRPLRANIDLFTNHQRHLSTVYGWILIDSSPDSGVDIQTVVDSATALYEKVMNRLLFQQIHRFYFTTNQVFLAHILRAKGTVKDSFDASEIFSSNPDALQQLARFHGMIHENLGHALALEGADEYSPSTRILKSVDHRLGVLVDRAFKPLREFAVAISG